VRGNPIKEWIIFSILWLVLLIPVIRLTGSRKPKEIDTVNQESASASIRATKATAVIRYTGKPLFINIGQHGKTLYRIEAPPAGETEQRLTLGFEESGVEILLQAEWPDETEHALEIELIVDNLEERKANLWAQQKLDELVSFSWE